MKFGFDTDRPLLIVANGPSSGRIDLSRIAEDSYIFRMNQFFLEKEKTLGSYVDAYFWSAHEYTMYKNLLHRLVHRDYLFERFFSPTDPKRLNKPFELAHERYLHPKFNYWEILAHDPALGKMLMYRPMPTTGVQVLAFAVLQGFTNIQIVGMDFYQGSSSNRYAFHIPEFQKKNIEARHLDSGYDTNAHAFEVDLAFFKRVLELDSKATITCNSENSYASKLVPLAPVLPTEFTPRPPTSTNAKKKQCAFVIPTVNPNTGVHKSIHGFLAALSRPAREKIEIMPLETLVEADVFHCIRSFESIFVNGISVFEQMHIDTLFREAPKIVFYVHECKQVLRRYFGRNPEGLLLLKQNASRIHFLAASPHVKRDLEYFLEIRELKIDIVYEAIPTFTGEGFSRLIRLRKGAKNIIMVGSVQNRKGAGFFSAVADTAYHRGLPYRFFWIGPSVGEEFDPNPLQLSPRVTWMGALPESDVSAVFDQADLMLLASEEDPFPLAALEALIHGCPVVCSHNVGTSVILAELFEHAVFEPDDVEAALSSIAELKPRLSTIEEALSCIRSYASYNAFGKRLKPAIGELDLNQEEASKARATIEHFQPHIDLTTLAQDHHGEDLHAPLAREFSRKHVEEYVICESRKRIHSINRFIRYFINRNIKFYSILELGTKDGITPLAIPRKTVRYMLIEPSPHRRSEAARLVHKHRVRGPYLLEKASDIGNPEAYSKFNIIFSWDACGNRSDWENLIVQLEQIIAYAPSTERFILIQSRFLMDSSEQIRIRQLFATDSTSYLFENLDGTSARMTLHTR